ncbi:ribonuclease H [Shouchella lonarensis]|uniref:Ribonuclease H n=1 Tax=Shouchella lonarensis TaxID=1464122 RepID=A0A1G6GG85_9BACI|nr:ribonuclease H family protein [Shouchella lonarensis]SDB80974.1 ribonuclease HI [Shouchella lonarensis]
MAKKKYYVVWHGRKQGVFDHWSACEEQVKGFTGAKFKSYNTKKEADEAFKAGPQNTASVAKQSPKEVKDQSGIIWDSISVDVGSRGNPGPVEYKGVDTKTGAILFEKKPMKMGTNNMGEFLAIVHGLAYVKKLGVQKPVYSDSTTAIGWVQKKKANATLKRTADTAEIWALVDRAEKWLKENRDHAPVLKWHTKQWGEIKADYGRKG